MWIISNFLCVACLICVFCFSGCLSTHDSLKDAEKSAATRAKQRLVFRMRLADAYDDANVETFAKAVSKGKVEQIDQFIEKGGDINHQGQLSVTPLYWGLHNYSGFCALLERGADPNVLFDDGTSVIFWATMKKDKRFLEMVLKYGGNPDIGEGGEFSSIPMHAAVMKKDLEAIEILLSAGANPSVTGKYGTTALEMAMCEGGKFSREFLSRVDSVSVNEKKHLLSKMEQVRGNMIPGHRKERELSSLIEIVSKMKTHPNQWDDGVRSE